MIVAKQEQVFTHFNVLLKDKTIMVVDEFGETKYHYEQMLSILKNYVTSDKIIVDQKFVSQYIERSCPHTFIISNKDIPFKIPDDSDRRFMCQRCNDDYTHYIDGIKQTSDVPYLTRLNECLTQDNFSKLFTLYLLECHHLFKDFVHINKTTLPDTKLRRQMVVGIHRIEQDFIVDIVNCPTKYSMFNLLEPHKGEMSYIWYTHDLYDAFKLWNNYHNIPAKNDFSHELTILFGQKTERICRGGDVQRGFVLSLETRDRFKIKKTEIVMIDNDI